MDINDLTNTGRLVEREIDISFKDATGKEFEFKVLGKLIDFLNDEASFWNGFKYAVDRKSSLEQQDPYYRQDMRALHLFERNSDYWTDISQKINEAAFSLNSNLDAIIEIINEKIDSNFLEYWFHSEHSFCRKGKDILENLGTNAANNFFAVFVNENSLTLIDTVNGFKGAMLGYEFQLQDENSLTDRVSIEEESVNELKDSISKVRDNLYQDIYSSKKKFEDDTDVQLEGYNEQFGIWLEKVENLENSYKEKLRLEPAATYWKTKADDYKKLGNRWAFILSGFVAVGLGIFGVLFYTWVNAQATAISIDSLQGVVLFITLLSVYAFAIKALSKLVFSSYHLQRDAEEREQLTYLYLSLTHEKDDFDTDARSIVLQALFSRADTGLISGDSSPTMPGVHEIINASSNR